MPMRSPRWKRPRGLAEADVNATDDKGLTALHRSAERGDVAAVEALAAAGANLDAKDKHGWTALLVAASQGHAAAIEALLATGADIEAKIELGCPRWTWAGAIFVSWFAAPQLLVSGNVSPGLFVWFAIPLLIEPIQIQFLLLAAVGATAWGGLLWGLARRTETNVRIETAAPETEGSEAMQSEERTLAKLRWGLVPSWGKDLELGANMINARSETVHEKPAFRVAFRRRRCVVPVNGWFEWRRENGEQQPYWIRPTGAEMFSLAGLWERWENGDEPVETFPVLTAAASASLADIYHRQPRDRGRRRSRRVAGPRDGLGKAPRARRRGRTRVRSTQGREQPRQQPAERRRGVARTALSPEARTAFGTGVALTARDVASSLAWLGSAVGRVSI